MAVATVLAGNSARALPGRRASPASPFGGGRRATRLLRARLEQVARRGLPFRRTADSALCTDNAAMIAFAASWPSRQAPRRSHALGPPALAARHGCRPDDRVGQEGGQGMTAPLDIIGAGAFGTALAITYAQAGHSVTLWAREGAAAMQDARENTRRLPGARFPDTLRVTGDLSDLTADCALLALPTQSLGPFLSETPLTARTLVSCAKGIDRATGLGPTALIAQHSTATPAQLTGPSFAVDIAAGLPTALTLACADDPTGAALQARLSTPHLRLYRTTDVTGAELGGALKNVVAIAAGAVIGAGLGDSARAALMARGLAEMTRIAVYLPEARREGDAHRPDPSRRH